jgi:hypothetical protein
MVSEVEKVVVKKKTRGKKNQTSDTNGKQKSNTKKVKKGASGPCV